MSQTDIKLDKDSEDDANTMASFIVYLNEVKKRYKFKTPEYRKLYANAGVLIDKINNYLLTKKLN
jgi:hypothetical protein